MVKKLKYLILKKNFNNIIDSYEIYKFLEHLILKKNLSQVH